MVTCPSGFYASSSSSCSRKKCKVLYFSNILACLSPCQNCLGSSTRCTECVNNIPYLYDDYCWESPRAIAAVVSQVGPASNLALTVSFLFSSGGSIVILAEVLQKLISYIKYLDLPYSYKLEEVLKLWQIEVLPFKIIPSLPSSILNYLESKPIPDNFSDYEVDPSFLVNFWDNMFIFLVAAAIWILLGIIIKCIINNRDKPGRLYSYLARFQVGVLKYLIIEVYSAYGDITMFSSLEMRSVEFEHSVSYLSFGLSLLFLILIISITCFHIWFIMSYQKLKSIQLSTGKKRETKEFLRKYSNLDVLYSEFKDGSFSQQAYLLYFNLRDAALNIVITTLFDYPLVQSMLFVSICLPFFVYLLSKTPLNGRLDNWQQVFFETLLLLIYICTMLIAIDTEWMNTEDMTETLSTMIYIMIMVYNVGVIVMAVINVFGIIIDAVKAWKARKQVKKLTAKKAYQRNNRTDLSSCDVTLDRSIPLGAKSLKLSSQSNLLLSSSVAQNRINPGATSKKTGKSGRYMHSRIVFNTKSQQIRSNLAPAMMQDRNSNVTPRVLDALSFDKVFDKLSRIPKQDLNKRKKNRDRRQSGSGLQYHPNNSVSRNISRNFPGFSFGSLQLEEAQYQGTQFRRLQKPQKARLAGSNNS